MICAECGAGNPDEAKVCESCGAALAEDAPPPTGRRSLERPVSLLVVAVVCFASFAVLFLLLRAAREKARRTKCASNLKCMGYALHLYSGDYGERFPAYGHPPCEPDSDPDPRPDLKAAMAGLGLLYPRYIPDGNVFVCPTALTAHVITRTVWANDPTTFGAGNSDYGYDPVHTATHSPTVAVMADQPADPGAGGNSPNHGGAGQNVLYIGSNVDWYPYSHCGHDGDEIYTPGFEVPAWTGPDWVKPFHSYILGDAP